MKYHKAEKKGQGDAMALSADPSFFVCHYTSWASIETLTFNTPSAQSAVTDLKDRTPGIYLYRAELINASGVTESAVISVTVQ